MESKKELDEGEVFIEVEGEEDKLLLLLLGDSDNKEELDVGEDKGDREDDCCRLFGMTIFRADCCCCCWS